MEGRRDRVVLKEGIKLLIAKMALGAIAAGVGIALLRVAGGREIIVAILIGLVPGIVDRSPKKLVYGLLFAAVGYSVGGRISAALAKSLIQEIPLGHWAIVGGFIGMTAGISRLRGQWFSFRFVVWSLGAAYGFFFGLIFGFFGDIGGLLAIEVGEGLGLQYYMKEVSFVCAGVFINLGAAIASILAGSLDNGLWRVARAVEKSEA